MLKGFLAKLEIAMLKQAKIPRGKPGRKPGNSTWKPKHHNKTATKTTVSLYLSKDVVEKARKHGISLSRITEEALSSIIDILEAQNTETHPKNREPKTESSKFLDATSFRKEVAWAGSSVWNERLTCTQEVGGSNPPRSTTRNLRFLGHLPFQ